MNRIASRVLVFALGVPVVVVLILLLPQYHHLALNAIVCAFCVIGTIEMTALFGKKSMAVDTVLVAVAGGALPAAAYLETANIAPRGLVLVILLAAAYAVLIRQILPRTPDGDRPFDKVLSSAAASFACIIYPGLFASFLVRLSSIRSASLVLLLFVILVFANDTAAYVFGSMFGRSSRGVSTVSPRKSLVGFIAGFVFSCAAAVVFYFIRPGVFSSSIAAALITGGIVGITTILGDLIESAFKRSADTKDSGTLIPGRGGVLDSIDSLLFSAPVLYWVMSWLVTRPA